MGRKPVLGLVGACLASVALVGCEDSSQLRGGSKKDVTAAGSTTGNSSAWNQPRQGQTGATSGNSANSFSNTSTAGPGAASATGATTVTPLAGGSVLASGNGTSGGSFNVNPRGPVSDYPEGRSMAPPADGGTGGLEHVGYSGPPPATNTVGNPNAPALPPLNGGPSATGPAAPLPLSTLPPVVSGGPARPRDDVILAPSTGRSPVVVPTPSPAATSSGADASGTAGAMPPPAPVPSVDAGGPGDLPPIPPPVSPTTQAFQSRPLPPTIPPLPRNGVPMSPASNPASFQQGAPQQ